jgi:2'-5' RNA ligase
MPAQRAVIVPTPPEVDADLADVRRRFDPQFNAVPSHLTLVFPHRVGSDALVHHVESVAGVHRPFRVHLAGFAGSQSAWLFARVTRGNDDLIALHDDLYTGTLTAALDRTSIYVPHVTVGRVNGASALAAALDAADRNMAWEFEVQALTIYRLGDARPGQIEAAIPLSPPARPP